MWVGVLGTAVRRSPELCWNEDGRVGAPRLRRGCAAPCLRFPPIPLPPGLGWGCRLSPCSAGGLLQTGLWVPLRLWHLWQLSHLCPFTQSSAPLTPEDHSMGLTPPQDPALQTAWSHSSIGNSWNSSHSCAPPPQAPPAALWALHGRSPKATGRAAKRDSQPCLLQTAPRHCYHSICLRVCVCVCLYWF